MANREIEAILRISSKLGSLAALKTLEREMRNVNRQANAFNRANSALETRGRAAWLATTRAIGPATLGLTGLTAAAARSYTAYAGVERRLNRIAINAGEGRAAVDGMMKAVNSASNDYAMAQDDVASGLEILVAAGRSAEDAMSFLPSVTATAQAAGAEIADIATTADAVSNSFDITGDRMQRAFDILVTSGKQGKFELKDMAQYLPTLAPAFAAMGYEGEAGLSKLASILQTIRIRTGDTSEAATAAQNIFQKMNSDETANKFKKFGIDLRSELAQAKKEGRDLVDVFMDLTEKATGGDLGKIPLIFSDAQFQVGMRALMAGREDLERFNAALKDVDGATLRDLGQVLSDNQSKIDRMASSWEKFKATVGAGIAPTVGGGLDFLNEGMTKADAINSQLEKQGMGFADRRLWWLKNGNVFSDQSAQADLAWKGGYRTQGERTAIDQYGVYGRTRAEAGDVPAPPLARDRRGMPVTGPIPAARSGSDAVAADDSGFAAELARQTRRAPRDRLGDTAPAGAAPARAPDFDPVLAGKVYDGIAADIGGDLKGAAADFRSAVADAVRPLAAPLPAQTTSAPMGPSFREAENASMAAYNSDRAAIDNAIEAGRTMGESIKGGADAGAQSIEEAARAIHAQSMEGGSVFARMLEGVGQRIGSEAAQAFKAGTAGMTVNVKATGLPQATGNRGNSMVNAGKTAGGRTNGF